MPVDPAPKRKIVVVDDNKDAAETLAVLLRQLGHEVQTAYDGPSAVTIARRMRPDLVFLDLALPGFDGIRVAEEIRADFTFNKTLVVALTGFASDYDRTRAHAAGVDLYLVKPVDVRFIESYVGDARSNR
jgi:CheY-like chemotaxis protein